MPFIGNQPALSYTSFAKQDFTTSATTSYTLDQPVANENEIALFINFVRQEPTTAYTASGTSLTLTSATSASDDMYCVFLGKAVQTVNPPNGSVGTAQLSDDAVTKAKTSNLMYPAFEAYLSSAQTVSNNTLTKVQFDTENLDTDSAYDNSTNYRFTVPSGEAGKYFVYTNAQSRNQTNDQLAMIELFIKKNGSNFRVAKDSQNTNGLTIMSTSVNAIMDLSVGDYLEVFGKLKYVSSGTLEFWNGTEGTYFGAYRIGD